MKDPTEPTATRIKGMIGWNRWALVKTGFVDALTWHCWVGWSPFLHCRLTVLLRPLLLDWPVMRFVCLHVTYWSLTWSFCCCCLFVFPFVQPLLVRGVCATLLVLSLRNCCQQHMPWHDMVCDHSLAQTDRHSIKILSLHLLQSYQHVMIKSAVEYLTPLSQVESSRGRRTAEFVGISKLCRSFKFMTFPSGYCHFRVLIQCIPVDIDTADLFFTTFPFVFVSQPSDKQQ